MINAMKAFKLLMKVHGVSYYQAFATSALREANNSRNVVELVKKSQASKLKLLMEGKRQKLFPTVKYLTF